MAVNHSQAFSPQDHALSETVGTSGTNTIDYLLSPHPPRNPYNPFLAPSTSVHDGLAQLIEPASHVQTQACQQGMPPFSPLEVPSSQVPLASGIKAAVAAQKPADATATQRASSPAATSPQNGQEEKSWPTKDVTFRGRKRKIIMQNENGPCSLFSLANILLLRGDVVLQPPDRPLVTYHYLSSLIAEYLLAAPETFGSQSDSSSRARAADDGAALARALSQLPQTQHGLNLNPSFLSNDSFVGQDGSQQLELFELLGVKLYHGFIPDASSTNTFQLLTRAGSYDAAVDVVVKGDDLASRFLSEGLRETGKNPGLRELAERGGMAVVESAGWGTAQDRNTLAAALEMSTFLEANSAQLTYPGLFALSSLPEGTLGALFRSNHLSVFYRPKAEETPAPTTSGEVAPLPAILTLMTDEAFADEELAVWESLVDIDGMDSGEIYDSRFRKRRLDAMPSGRQQFGTQPAATGNEDADYALALQLYSEERDRGEQQTQRWQQQQTADCCRNAQYPRCLAAANCGAGPGATQSNARKFGVILSFLGIGKRRQTVSNSHGFQDSQVEPWRQPANGRNEAAETDSRRRATEDLDETGHHGTSAKYPKEDCIVT